jgi:hypothetical protein
VTATRYNGNDSRLRPANGIRDVAGVQAALDQGSTEIKRHLSP